MIQKNKCKHTHVLTAMIYVGGNQQSSYVLNTECIMCSTVRDMIEQIQNDLNDLVPWSLEGSTVRIRFLLRYWRKEQYSLPCSTIR